MGFIRVRGLIGGTQEQAQEVEFLVDSGSYYTVLPEELAASLHIAPTALTARGVLADRREVEMPLALAYLKLLDREAGILVGIFDAPAPLLGASALEALGLKLDPVKGSLNRFYPGLCCFEERTRWPD